MGYSVVLWNIPEQQIQSGQVVPVYIKSNISHIYVIGTASGEKIEVPVWQLTEPVKKHKVKAIAAKYAENAAVYASVKLDGLPCRAEPVNTAKQVYRLRKGEIIKILFKGQGQAPMAGKAPLEGDWYKILTEDGTTGWCFSYNLNLYKTDASGNIFDTASSATPGSIFSETGELHVIQRGTHQAHVMLGTRAYPFNHPLRLPLYVLNNLLGGPAMNARLNISLRERRGLVYTVESAMTCYSDTGVWSVYFGCDPDDVKSCLRLIRRDLDNLMQNPLSDRQLQAAKRQLKGQISVSSDNRESFALDFGRSFLLDGREHELDRLCERIDAVSADQIQQVAQELFSPDRLTTLIIQ